MLDSIAHDSKHNLRVGASSPIFVFSDFNSSVREDAGPSAGAAYISGRVLVGSSCFAASSGSAPRLISSV
jgi:hypothetical protein